MMKQLQYWEFSNSRKRAIKEIKNQDDFNDFVFMLVNRGWTRNEVCASYCLLIEDVRKIINKGVENRKRKNK